jgi:geranylgeranyl diphosphate synthase type II
MKQCPHIDFERYIETKKREIDRALDGYLQPESSFPQNLHTAMRYSVLSGGKRFRPILCIAGFEACGGEGPEVMPVACALELIHAYSLIHDDLPCMDDDDLRRGRPTTHKAYGEATAVLAGDALLTFAVELLVRELPQRLGVETTIRILEDLLAAIGTEGMVAGQTVDMEYEGRDATPDVVEYIHSRKTGALIASSVRTGAIAAGASAERIARLGQYGQKLGLAFQIVDDILDAEGRFGDLKSGRDLDRQRRKATYPLVLGLDRSRALARELVEQARELASELGKAGLPLLLLAELVINRSN